MQVVILAGGLGTRLSEETVIKPKPMVEIGGKPIIWHIMKHYAHYGHNEFVICLGYKGYMIKERFSNYFLHNNDVTIDIKTNKITVHNNHCDDWKITLVDTGDATMTGGRIKRVKDYIQGDEFMLTYGDGVSDVDINKLIEFHKSHGKLATLSAIQPEGKFGRLGLDGDQITEFAEKKDNEDSWINGGFMVLNKKIMNYINSDFIPFEKDPLENIAKDGELIAYKHSGFWFAMDTLQNKNTLENMWQSGNAKWKTW
ncbi:MAG: glucose-1-phosphate cytidylyltransferase [Candidatus Absconditabacteria bacterium]|nr:glucose-1-phosphate cytidylyltransferase [Candidatus Absconditabacteria bacterium]